MIVDRLRKWNEKWSVLWKLFYVVLDKLEWIKWNRIGFRKNDGWWECDYLCFLYKSDNFFINM